MFREVKRYAAYGEKMKLLRENAGLTQSECAKILHVSQRGYSHYEVGDRCMNVAQIVIIAEYFDVDPNYLLGCREDKGSFPKKKSSIFGIKRGKKTDH